jgi:endo-1,4-beta-xylanase
MRYQNAPTYNPLVHGPVAPPLKDLFARRGLLFGTSSGTSSFGTLMAARENSMRVDQGRLLMGITQAVEGVWDFTTPGGSGAARAVADYANANNLVLHQGGHLIYHIVEPAWLSNYSSASGLRGKLRQHIEQTIAAFPEYQSWNVCNEVIEPTGPGGWYDSRYYQVFGANWPNEFFTYTRTLTSKELIWNDYQPIERIPDTAFNLTMNALVSALNAGVPINTYGCQMHLYKDSLWASGAQMVDRMNQIAALGLDIRITEFDIDDRETMWPIATRRTDQVAAVESRLGPVFAQVPRLKSFNMWGQNDADSWLNGSSVPRADGALREFLPYDRRGFIKPEWWEMFERVTRP